MKRRLLKSAAEVLAAKERRIRHGRDLLAVLCTEVEGHRVPVRETVRLLELLTGEHWAWNDVAQGACLAFPRTHVVRPYGKGGVRTLYAFHGLAIKDAARVAVALRTASPQARDVFARRMRYLDSPVFGERDPSERKIWERHAVGGLTPPEISRDLGLDRGRVLNVLTYHKARLGVLAPA